jgi:hypothetical protein
MKRYSAAVLAGKYPLTASYLSPSANIVHSPTFESAIVKVVSGKADTLTVEE